MNGDESVPMIGCTDQHSIHVLVLEKLAIVKVSGDAVVGLPCFLGVVTVHQTLGVFHSFAVKVADSRDLYVVVFPHAWQIMNPRDAPVPDGADVNSVAGGCLPED